MDLQVLFSPEFLILLEAIFIGALFLYLAASKNFTNGIYIWLLVYLLFGYQRIDASGSLLPDISLERILFAFLVIMFVMEVLMNKHKIFHIAGIERSMFLFGLLVIISMFYTGSFLKEGGRLQMGTFIPAYVYPFGIFFISQSVYDSAEKREGFIKFLMLMGLYLTSMAIFEHFGIDRFVFPKYILDPTFGIHQERARGPFAMAATNGMALGFVFMGSFYFLLKFKKKILWKICSSALLALTPFAIFFTYTRGPWMGTFFGLMILVMFSLRHRKRFFITTLIILSIITILGSYLILDEDTAFAASRRIHNEEPVYDRLNLFIASINMFAHHPIFGVGFGKFSEHVADYYRNIDGIPFRDKEVAIHETFTGILTETGLVGLTLILSIYIFIISKSIRLYRYLTVHDIESRDLVAIFWAIMAIYFVSSLFVGMRYCGFINVLFYIFAGIICGWERRVNEKIA